MEEGEEEEEEERRRKDGKKVRIEKKIPRNDKRIEFFKSFKGNISRKKES